jgi:WD40 repeat protein
MQQIVVKIIISLLITLLLSKNLWANEFSCRSLFTSPGFASQLNSLTARSAISPEALRELVRLFLHIETMNHSTDPIQQILAIQLNEEWTLKYQEAAKLGLTLEQWSVALEQERQSLQLEQSKLHKALVQEHESLHPYIIPWSIYNTLQGHTHYVISAQFSPDGKFIVTASLDKTAIIWTQEIPPMATGIQ